MLFLVQKERQDKNMVEQDTVKLLRECDAGIRMGITSIDDVLPYVSNDAFRQKLTDCRAGHETLKKEIRDELDRFHDEGKDPNPVAKGMSWVKTNVKLAVNDSDKTVADLMTDGCGMGIKSLSRYLNQYAAADESSKNYAKRLIGMEETLVKEIRSFL